MPGRPLLMVALLIVAVACGGPSTGTATTPPSDPRPSYGTVAPVASGSGRPAPSPPGAELVLGQTFGLFYDPGLEQVVLVNGAVEDGPDRPTELWGWSGTAWELLDGAGPPARSFAAIGRDPERDVVVMHGGVGSRGQTFDETLEWNGEDWSMSTVSGPGPREGAGLAHDAASNRMVLFGGATGATQQADTWAWDGGDWQRIAETGPRPRFVSLMTEDRATDGILLQGGHWVDGNDGDFLADTWRWREGAWLEAADAGGPGPRVNSPGAWDDRLGGIVMFGGGTGLDTPMAADTWRWTKAWSEISAASRPTPRNGHAMAFDVKRAVLVLVGGIARPGGSQQLDVWELGPDGWHQAFPQP